VSIDPCVSVQAVALRMRELETRRGIETALDELEYVFDVIPPKLHERE